MLLITSTRGCFLFLSEYGMGRSEPMAPPPAHPFQVGFQPFRHSNPGQTPSSSTWTGAWRRGEERQRG